MTKSAAQQIKIRLRDGTKRGRPHPVDAVVFGVWAAHPVVLQNGMIDSKFRWCVTHVPSGLAVPLAEGTRYRAVSAAKDLAARFPHRTMRAIKRDALAIRRICDERGLAA